MSALKNVFLWLLVAGVPLLLFFGGYIATPILMLWSWARWMRHPRQWTPNAILSLAALVFATASGLLAISALVYSSAIGGNFPNHFDNPLFMQMFRRGIQASWMGIALGIGGLWRPSLLRWHSLVCAVGTLMFWTATGGD